MKRNRVVISFLLVLTMLFMSITIDTIDAAEKASSIKFDKTSYTVRKGEKLKLKVSSNKNKVVWKSSNEKVASVSQNGIVTTKKVGKVTITATLKGTKKKAKCYIRVGNAVKKVSVNKNKVTLTEKKKFTIKTTVLPSNAANKSVTYKSSNTSVATVSSKGVITAKKAGKAVIKVTAKDKSKKSATISVTVQKAEVLVKNVLADKFLVTLKEGEKTNLTVSVSPSNATNKGVVYQSSDASIATVDQNGEVTAKKAGTCKITVTAIDGSNKSDTVSIRVVSKTTIPPEENVTPGGSVNPGGSITPGGSVNPGGSVKPGGSVTPGGSGKPNPVISVTGVSVTPAEKALNVGNSFQLTTSVTPSNATNKSVTYQSSNTNVVTVDQTGIIHAVGNGTANITVTTNDQGKTAVCKVTVTGIVVDTENDTNPDKATATVSTQAALNEALNNSDVTNVIVQTEEEVVLSFPAKEFAEKTLMINAPNAEIKNYGTFKKIIIQAIAENTFYEYATENSFDVAASKGRIVVSKDSKVEINVENGSKKIGIKNDGILSLNVDTQSEITIDGSSTIPVSVKVNAKDASISTGQELTVVATETFQLLLRPGAENTEVEVDTKESIPTINGLGRVPIMVSDTKELEMVVANQSQIAGLNTVTVKGSIVNDKNQPVNGAVISVVPYNADITQDNCESYVSGAVKTAVSGVTGTYEFKDLVIGNYVIITKHADYKTTYQVVTITSDAGSEYTNRTTYVVDVTQTEQGNIEGTVIDAKTGLEVTDGIILRLRNGFDNLSGAPIKETKTNGQGAYQFSDLDTGAYTIQLFDKREKSAYSTTSVNVQVVSEKTASSQIAVSSLDSSNQVRIVLTWGDESSGGSKDLDSHLVGPRDAENAKFHT